jgi:hypothetical protein
MEGIWSNSITNSMTNEQLIKTYTSDILDLIYNFKPDAWKYLSQEQQKVIMEHKGGIVTILITVMTTYFSIVRKLDGLNVIQNNVNVISTKVENNSEDIKNLQQHTIPSLDNRMSIMEEKMKDKVFIKDLK